MTPHGPPTHRFRSLLLVGLLLPLGGVPGVEAWHATNGVEPPGSISPFPEEPLTETFVDPIDDALQDLADAGRDANEVTNSTYRVIGTTLNAVKESITGETVANNPLTLMRDGIGPDGREGGFGDWKVLGHQAWGINATAAAHGAAGYTQATLDGGLYRGNAASLLVSPEIDLATNFRHTGLAVRDVDEMAPGEGQSVPVPEQPSFTVYGLLYAACSVADVPLGLCAAYRDTLQQIHTHSFEYTMRHNLAVNDQGTKGWDGVSVIVFAEEPRSVEDAGMCTSGLPILALDGITGCRVAHPSGTPRQVFPYAGGYPYNEVEAMPTEATTPNPLSVTAPHYPGYSGYSDWARHSIDLTPWEGQSVWIGFHFASKAIPSRFYWESPSRFNTDAGFFGFQLDDVEAKGLAAPINLKARIPTQPDLIPDALLGDDGARPTLRPHAPVPVQAEVVNLGTTSVDVRAVLRVLAPNGSVVQSADGTPYENWTDEKVPPLPPGATLVMSHEFPGLSSGIGYSAQVCTYRVADGPRGGDETFCDEPPQPGACSGDGLDADPCDEWNVLTFDVRPIVKLDVGAIQRDADRIGIGDTISMVLPLHNQGNVPLTFTVQAAIADVSSGEPRLRQDMLKVVDEGQLQRTVTLRPNGNLSLNWSMQALNVGQFHLLVDIRDEFVPIDFDAVHDMLPPVLRPWRASAVAGDITIDGDLGDPDWLDNTTALPNSPLQGLRVGNTDDRLYLGFRVNENRTTAMTVFFDDRRDGKATGYVINATGLWPLHYSADSLTWESQTQTSVGAQGARTPNKPSNNEVFAYEMSIPLGVGADEHGLIAMPGDDARVLIRYCGTPDPSVPCDHFPFGAPLGDGAGILEANQSLADEVAHWHKIRLTDRAPSAVPPLSERILSPGFGVNAVPPPYLFADFDACPLFRGWSTTSTLVGDVKDSWNCGAYGDDGRTLLYQGVTPDSQCPDGCGQYTAVNGQRVLTTPLFTIPPDAADPTVVLSHQYSTKVRLYDMEREVSDNLPPYHKTMPRVVFQDSRVQSYLEIWNETTGVFDMPLLLRPNGGYTTEEKAGIDDPTFDRIFMLEGMPWMPSASHSDWLETVQESRSWWWPQGHQPIYHPPDRPLPTGGDFTGGSPWVTDTIPLGTGFQEMPDLRGKTVRLRFEHSVAPTTPTVGDIRLDEIMGVSGNGPKIGDFFGTNVARYGGFFASLDDAQLPLSEVHPFTAVCWTDMDGDGQFTERNRNLMKPANPSDNAILTTHPDGCNGRSLATDLPLTLMAPESGSRSGGTYKPGSPAGLRLDATKPNQDCTSQCASWVNLPYRHFDEKTVFDWVDDGDGVHGYGDHLYLNVGGTPRVEPRDVLISRDGGTKFILTTVPYGGPGIYCGTTKCNPDADVGHVTDIVFYDQNMDGQWTPGTGSAIDRAYFPSRVFSSGDEVRFDRAEDWGWRIGGLAVIEGKRFVRDLAVQDAVLVSGSDALEQGVGPGTAVPVRVTVNNLGSNDLGSVFVGLTGEDAQTGEMLCDQTRSLGGILVSEEARDILMTCAVPSPDGMPDVEGRSLALRATVWREGGGAPEDFLGNNQQRVRGIFPIQASPDAAIHAFVSPQDATADTPRTVTIQVENRGNVPLRDVTVHATIARVSDDGRTCTTLCDKTWVLSDEVALGKTVTLSERVASTPSITRNDLRFQPPGPGHYILLAEVSMPGDVDPGNDRADARIRALARLYENPLEPEDKGLVTTPGVVVGDITLDATGIWTYAPNSHDGTTRLVAGDPATGEIPEGTDASFRLPTIDLRTLRDATLSFNHRYDLEEGFDAARVEISADGGQTWSPAMPRPQGGLPEGYPSTPLVGVNAILGNDFELTALAYTGRSEDIGSASNGWIASEIDLTRQSDFFKPSVIDNLALDGLHDDARTDPLVRGSGASLQPQFTHLDPALKEAGPPYWSMDESQWFADHRYWWIENKTYSGPHPLSAGRMWWSGSAGTAGPGETLPRVATRLELPIDPSGWDLAEGEEAVLSWWDWRAGWNDGDQRAGTGGEFHATLLTPQAPAQGGAADPDWDDLSDATEAFHTRSDPTRAEVGVRVEEMLDNGWTRRSIPLSRLLESNATTGVAFTYLSGEADGIGVSLLTPLWPAPTHFMMAYNQDNMGWFIDGVEILAVDTAGSAAPIAAYDDLGSLFQNQNGEAGNWTAVVAGNFSGAVPNDDTRWSLVGPGAGQRDGGWHLEEMDIPGRGTTTAWRFNSSDPEGYPAGANSRVVTPLVDLRDQDGEQVSLRFDHRYGFHGGKRAVDAGAVAYQVYDEGTGEFGPWTSLGAQVPDDVGFISGSSKFNWQLSELPAEFRAMGYPAMAVIPADALGGGSRAFTTSFGQDFPTAPGFIRTNFLNNYMGWGYAQNWKPWQPYPFAYVFSGDSDGWENVEWEISHLVGERVRFGFQAWTNPSERPCGSTDARGTTGEYLGTPSCSTTPRHGWSVANVAVVGKTFQGGLADIRFRVATDDSFSKGEWSIDDIQLSGTRFRANVEPRIAPDAVLAIPGSTVTFDGEIINLGTEPRTGLALGISAFRTDTGDPWAVTLEDHALLDAEGVPVRIHDVYGPFDLHRGGQDESRLPVQASLVLPLKSGVDVEVRFEMLEAQTTCAFVGEEQQCTTTYGVVRNEVGGAAAIAWTLTAESRLDLRFVPPLEDRPVLIVVQPGAPTQGQPIDLSARLVNQGTIEPTAKATWTIDHILRKGDPVAQAGMTIEQKERVMDPVVVDLGTMMRGDEVDLQLTIDPAQVPHDMPEGLYRATLEVDPGQGASKITRTSVEFVVGTGRPYYRVDFADPQSPPAVNWTDVSPSRDAGPNAPGSPDDIRFRQVGTQFLWGVTHAQDAAGATYCRPNGPSGADVCNSDSQARGGNVFGLQGIATTSELVDLGRVVNDNATLTLQHGFHFQDPGDGARLEILPLRTPVTGIPRAAYQCVGNGNPDMWFVIPAEDPLSQQARVLSIDPYLPNPRSPDRPIPRRINPINENPIDQGSGLSIRESLIPAFGGPGTSSQTARFHLDQEPEPYCPSGSNPPPEFEDAPPPNILNYTVRLRLNVGTLPGLTWACQNQQSGRCVLNPPGGRPGDMGWQIDSLGISSIDVQVTPESRSLPVFDGYPKRFSFFVTNLGHVEETFTVSLDPQASSGLDASWFNFTRPDITLAPGQQGAFTFDVEVPPAAARGDLAARFVARSNMDPNIADFIDLTLRLEETPLPDLVLQLSGDQQVEQGTVVQLSTTVFNVGLKESDDVPLEVHVVREETGALLGTKAIGKLCPDTVCGEQGSSQTVVFEWHVPEDTGPYTINAMVDPEGKLLEMSKATNKRSLLVNVIPLQRPDVAITDLQFEGLDEQGYAWEGDLVAIVANVTNLGRAPASNVPVRIISGTAEILNVRLEQLMPGESRLVTATRLVTRGEVSILAATTPGGDDVDITNNELRRVLRVRGLELTLQPPAEPVALTPGGSAMTQVNLTNHGNVVEKVLLEMDPAYAGWGLAVSPNPVPAAPGTTTSALVILVAPDDAIGGPHTLYLLATPLSRPSVVQKVALPVHVALSDDAPQMRLDISEGGALNVHLAGHSNAPEGLILTLLEPVWMVDPVTVSLQPRANASVAIAVVPPPDAPPGPTQVVVQAHNSTGVLRAQANGTLHVATHMAGAVSWAGVSEPRQQDLTRRLIEYKVNITNQGNVPLVPMLVATNLTEGFLQVEAERAPSTVLPGKSTIASVVLETSVELTGQAGGVLEVVGHAPLADGESVQAAPAFIGRLDIPTLVLADLEVVRMRVLPQGAVSVGEPLQISITVRNMGLVPSPATELFGFVNGALVNAYDLAPLDPGAETVVNMTWSFKGPGDHLIYVLADGPGLVEELHADNNGQNVVVEVTQSATSRWADKAVPGPGAVLLLLALALVALRRRAREGGAK